MKVRNTVMTWRFGMAGGTAPHVANRWIRSSAHLPTELIEDGPPKEHHYPPQEEEHIEQTPYKAAVAHVEEECKSDYLTRGTGSKRPILPLPLQTTYSSQEFRMHWSGLK